MNFRMIIRHQLSRHDAVHELALLNKAGLAAECPQLLQLAQNPRANIDPIIGFTITAPRSELEAAHAVLGVPRGRPDTAYACPNCGAQTRRLRALMPIFFVSWALGWIFPFFRRKRICPACQYRFMPSEVEAFTSDELGYDPDAKNPAAEVLAWSRSIGNHKLDSKDLERRDEP